MRRFCVRGRLGKVTDVRLLEVDDDRRRRNGGLSTTLRDLSFHLNGRHLTQGLGDSTAAAVSVRSADEELDRFGPGFDCQGQHGHSCK